jgi:hypothetical protein
MTDKWGRRLFKTGGVVLIIMGLVHSLSFLREMTGSNDTERQLLGLMSSYQFNLAGSMRSMADLLQGFSVAFMLAALGFGLLDLAVARERSGLLKRVALVNVIWLAAMTADSLRYFFVIPISFFSVALVIFLLAWWQLPAEETHSSSAA